MPILLDFGLVKRFCPDMRLAFARMVYSSNVMDVDALLQSFNEMGLKIGGQADPFQDLANVRRMFKTVKSSEAKEAKEKWARERKERENEAPRLKRPIEAWPNEFVFFFRVNGLLRGLCSALEVDIPYLDVMGTRRKTHSKRPCLANSGHKTRCSWASRRGGLTGRCRAPSGRAGARLRE